MNRLFLDATITLALGLAMGWAIVGDRSTTRDSLLERESNSTPAVASTSVDSTEDVFASSDDLRCQDAVFTAEQTPDPLPSVYYDVVGPFSDSDKALRAYGRYVSFALEARDEPWAAAMESGIATWSAERGLSDNMGIEYFQCRSSSCIVATYSSTGETVSLSTMKAQGWWQADDFQYSAGKSYRDGSMRFLTFIGRYPETAE